MPRYLISALGAFGLHAAAIVWLTWPVAARAATDLPARFGRPIMDCLLLAWALAHQSRALVSDPWALPHANAFHPTRYALFYGEAGFGAVPLFAPVFVATGNPTLALNFTWLAGVLLTATALHLVIARWTGSWTAGLVAGWFFLTQHWVLWTWIPIAPNYAVLAYLPVIMWLAAKPITGFAGVLGLGALITLQGLSSIYLAAATVLPLAVLAFVRLICGATRKAGLRLLAALGLAMAILVLPYSGYLVVRAQNPQIGMQTVYMILRFGEVVLPWGPFTAGQPMALSLTALSVIVIGLGCHVLSRREVPGSAIPSAWSHGALWAAVGLVASLPPRARWNGTPLLLPHAWFARYAPIYEVLRSPDRLGVAGLMGLTLLIGTAFAESARSLIRVRRAAVRAALTAALAGLVSIGLYLRYAEAGPDWLGFDPTAPLPRAYPLSPPALLSPVLAEPVAARPGPLLELPIGPGVNPHAEAMYRSIFHRRPLLNGYDGYWPAQFPSRMQLACGLPDPGALRELRRRTGVETILVHLAVLDDAAGAALPYGCPHDMPRRTAWLEAASGPRSDLRLLARDADDLLFATDPAGTDIGEGDVHPGF